MRRRSAILGLVLIACGSVALSCTSDNDDPVGRACSVIVGQCHVMADMGDCIDAVGDITNTDCVLCIGQGMACDYGIQCPRQFLPDGCDFPASIIPKGERSSTDAGSPPVSSGTDAGR
jgi:hypothetical protein